MEETAEDSDATVAGDEVEDTQMNTDDCILTSTGQQRVTHSGHYKEASNYSSEGTNSDSNDTGSSSPSLLQSIQKLSVSRTVTPVKSGRGHQGNGKREIAEDVVPCSSSSDEEQLSQEFPPLQPTKQPVKPASFPNTPSNHSDTTAAEEQTLSDASHEPSLQDVIKDQNTLLSSLKKSEGLNEKFVEDSKKNASRIEQNLKTISLSNQHERRRLASERSQLLSQSQSQGEMSEGTQSIRTQLLELAGKQKQLLQCFVRQKEISNELSRVMQTMQHQKLDISIFQDSAYQTSRSSGTDQQMSTNKCTSLTSVTSSTRTCVTNNSLTASFKPTSSSAPSGSLSQMRQHPSDARNPNMSVAFPNLSKHLLQPQTLLQQPNASIYQPRTVLSSNQTNQSTYQLAQPFQLTTQPLQSSTQSLQSSTLHSLSSAQSLAQIHSDHSYASRSQAQTRSQSMPAVSKPPSVSSNELAHPVPLKTLIKHGLIQPEKDCISCTILGCNFKASLSSDGSILSQDGSKHQLPQQWVKSCWARLGHPNKMVKTKSTYSSILYKGVTLLQFCEKYSLKQVSSYLNQSKASSEASDEGKQTHPQTGNTIMTTQSSTTTVQPTDIIDQSSASPTPPLEDHLKFDISKTLTSGSVFVRQWGESQQSASLDLPEDFWENREYTLSYNVIQQIQCDLDW